MLGDELDRQRVDAVPRVLGRKALAMEDVPQVPAAGRAQDLDAVAVGVGLVPHRSRDLLVKAGPAAARVELAVGGVQWGVAAPADVGAFLKGVLVFAGEGPLGALVDDDALFSRGE